MPKPVISFKPTPDCEVQLAELMDRWKCDRTAAIVRAIAAMSGEALPPKISGEFKEKRVVRKPAHRPREPMEVAKAIRTGRTLTGRPHGSVPKGKK